MNSVEDTTADGGKKLTNAECDQVSVGRRSKQVAQANGTIAGGWKTPS